MRKGSLLLLVFILIGFVSVGLANALSIGWPICVKDPAYSSQYEVEVVNGIIRGQATLSGNAAFPAPLTGYITGGYAYFWIAYLNSSGLRFYYIALSDKSGQTWGISSSDSSFYDSPHSASLQTCTMIDEDVLEGDSGAMDW